MFPSPFEESIKDQLVSMNISMKRNMRCIDTRGIDDIPSKRPSKILSIWSSFLQKVNSSKYIDPEIGNLYAKSTFCVHLSENPSLQMQLLTQWYELKNYNIKPTKKKVIILSENWKNQLSYYIPLHLPKKYVKFSWCPALELLRK